MVPKSSLFIRIVAGAYVTIFRRKADPADSLADSIRRIMCFI